MMLDCTHVHPLTHPPTHTHTHSTFTTFTNPFDTPLSVFSPLWNTVLLFSLSLSLSRARALSPCGGEGRAFGEAKLVLAIEGRRVSREAASDPPRLVRGLVLLSIPSDGDGERSLAEILKSQCPSTITVITM